MGANVINAMDDGASSGNGAPECSSGGCTIDTLDPTLHSLPLASAAAHGAPPARKPTSPVQPPPPRRLTSHSRFACRQMLRDASAHSLFANTRVPSTAQQERHLPKLQSPKEAMLRPTFSPSRVFGRALAASSDDEDSDGEEENEEQGAAGVEAWPCHELARHGLAVAPSVSAPPSAQRPRQTPSASGERAHSNVRATLQERFERVEQWAQHLGMPICNLAEKVVTPFGAPSCCISPGNRVRRLAPRRLTLPSR